MSAIINNFSSLLGPAMPIVGMTAIQVLAKKVIFDPSDSQGKKTFKYCMIVGASSLITPLAYQLLRRPFSLKTVAINTALATAAGYLLDPYLGQKTKPILPEAHNFKKLASTFSTLDAFVTAHYEDLLKGTWFKSPTTKKIYHLTLFAKKGLFPFLRVIEDSAEKSLSPYERKFWVFTTSGELPILKDQEKLDLNTMIPTLAEVSISTKNDAEPLFSCPLFYRFTDQFNQSYMDVLLNYPTLFPNEFIAHLHVGQLFNIDAVTSNSTVIPFAIDLALVCQNLSSAIQSGTPLQGEGGQSTCKWTHSVIQDKLSSIFTLELENNQQIQLKITKTKSQRIVTITQQTSLNSSDILFAYTIDDKDGTMGLYNHTSTRDETIKNSPLLAQLQTFSPKLAEHLIKEKIPAALGNEWLKEDTSFPTTLQKLTLSQQLRVAYAPHTIPEEALDVYFFNGTVANPLCMLIELFKQTSPTEIKITKEIMNHGSNGLYPFVMRKYTLEENSKRLTVVISLTFPSNRPYLATHWQLIDSSNNSYKCQIHRNYSGENSLGKDSGALNTTLTSPSTITSISETVESWAS